MYRREYPTFAMPPSVPLRPLGSSRLGDLRREWAGRDVNLVPAGQGAGAWLLVDFDGQRGWLPVGLRTLGQLYRAVGGDSGRVRGGAAFSFGQPVAFSTLAGLEPHTYSLVEQALRGLELGENPHLGSFFGSIGSALSSVVNAARKAASQAAQVAGDIASSVADAARKAASQAADVAKSAASAIQENAKYVVGGALIVGGVALGVTGVGLPAAGALVGAGVGTMTKSGSSLGKFKEWAVPAAIGAAAGAALGFGVQWVMEGGLTQVGSALFGPTGEQVATVGTASATTGTETAAATGAVAAATGTGTTGTAIWAALPAGAILKTATGFVMKQLNGSPAPVDFAPGAAPTSSGMSLLPRAATGTAPAEPAGIDSNMLLIAGVAAAAILVLGLGR
jgi:hypothetical protein